ncbi:hypothetical protein M3P05_04440 [Sansalvadorimonas sp. 2012CJ34-2]|uniref:Uncharacterized protein n=1 Tax=Parendozoicomonas callyspongiae TaxID=2942213 RepID=A0ABT0PCS4_9GAMM|nr:hypothetical protein [Sansalvadorimonas sp. 2012CJ34-2]MCL6269192.1 hypothetical protein [Sansalvadorimonas sp. 2012CJ34-2]
MSQVLVFNHHSLPFDSQSSARAAIPEFIQVTLRCRGYGYNLMLLDESMDPNWFQVQLAPDYAWRNWYDEACEDSGLKEVVRAFRSLQTRQPLLTDVDLEKIGYCREVGLKGESAGLSALLACHFYNSFLVSLPISEKWTNNELQAWVFDVDEDENDFSETGVVIDNIFSSESLVFHQGALEHRRAEQLATGKELWNKRKEFFDGLEFLDDFGTQLKTWGHRADILSKARDALLCMNDFVHQWNTGGFTDYQHEHLSTCGLSAKVSGESSSINKDPKKRSEREFWLPKGVKVNCQNHVTLPGGYRLHFYPESSEKTIYIAYLGPHLTL